MPTAAGGGFDRTTRMLQPHMEAALGVPLEVVYRGGGGFAIGATTLLREGADCHNVMIHGTPLLHFSHLTQNVRYTWDDFFPVGSVNIDPGVVRVRNDSPWRSLEELIEDAHARPGQIRVGIAGRTDVGHFGIREIERAAGVDFNIIFYDGGGPARTALAGGEVEVTHTGAYNSLPVAEESRVLAVHQPENLWKDITDGAPTVGQALSAEVQPNDFRYQMWVTRACRDNHPEHYAVLAEALESAVESPGYLAALESAGEFGSLDYIPGDEYMEMLLAQSEEFEAIALSLNDR
ncbi:MAG: tripartite tricarboxylate transporter substrate binding protein [Gammaproteobacteria bacterium]|nr:MAG: tripartite tricarboxylate transporter substrate binding protein [Gammaproteobacteria bacterium]